MTWQIGVVYGLTIVAVVLLATEKLASDVVALLVATVLLVTGILTPEQGFAGFANTAIVTIAAMFVLSAGLARAGAVNVVGRLLDRIARRNAVAALLALMVGVGALSAFLNNTAAVAIMIPVVLGLARRTKTSPSKLLMPLSFASMFGGVCTLIGTSTNLLGNSIAIERGYPGFGMFEFALLGLVFFVSGTVYMLTAGRWLVPDRRGGEGLANSFGLRDYITDVTLQPEAASVGKPLGEAPLLADSDIEVLQIIRGGRRIGAPRRNLRLRAGDVLRLLCRAEDIPRLRDTAGITFAALHGEDDDLEAEDIQLVEVVVAPNSLVAGKSLRQIRLREQFGAIALALRRRHGELMRGNVGNVRLRPGDALLFEIATDQLDHLLRHHRFLVVSQSRYPEIRRRRIPLVVGIMVAVVAVAAAGVTSIAVSSVAGAMAMVLTGCLTPEDAYDAIEWRVLFLLAGMLALGKAMQTTGAADLLAGWVLSNVRELGPTAILSALYLFTSLLTEVMSNNAAVVLLAPIAVVTAESMGLSPRPFLLAVMFAASSSFMTPVGYQTNTMILGPGRYRFRDFLIVGSPLNLLFWLIATFVIPLFWPFTPQR